jgi:hypothetical protein
MGRTLDTIIEVDVSDDDMACNTNKGNMKSTCEAYNILESATLGKEIEYGSFAKVLEICEPDSELDPETKDLSLPLLKEALKLALSTTKTRKKKSLIDKAFTHQQGQLSQDAHADVEKQLEPAYIWLADLAADWARYIPKPVTSSSQNPMPVGNSQDANVQSSVGQLQTPEAVQVQTASSSLSSHPKRSNRKKSLIDKAASRQRKELAAQCRQPESQEMKAMGSQESKTTYCSLCEDGMGRKSRSSCGLCNSRA